MRKQITTATLIGALLALSCLVYEQQSAAASGEHRASARVTRTSPSPFGRHMRYSNVQDTGATLSSYVGDFQTTVIALFTLPGKRPGWGDVSGFFARSQILSYSCGDFIDDVTLPIVCFNGAPSAQWPSTEWRRHFSGAATSHHT